MVLETAASVNRALRRFFRFDGEDGVEEKLDLQHATKEMIHLTSVLHERDIAGRVTSLRQLHSITNLSQREALSAARSLELASVVKIETDHADALASIITLSEQAKRKLSVSSS